MLGFALGLCPVAVIGRVLSILDSTTLAFLEEDRGFEALLTEVWGLGSFAGPGGEVGESSLALFPPGSLFVASFVFVVSVVSIVSSVFVCSGVLPVVSSTCSVWAVGSILGISDSIVSVPTAASRLSGSDVWTDLSVLLSCLPVWFQVSFCLRQSSSASIDRRERRGTSMY